jgi:hypothetical protein
MIGRNRLIRLPKISSLPSRQNLREMLMKAQEMPGSIIELSFGDTSENYSLTSAKEQRKDCVWTLYRGEGATSMVEWSHASNDPEQVLGFITAQFPGWSMKSKVLTEEMVAPQTITDGYPSSNYQSQNYQSQTQNYQSQSATSGAMRPAQRSTLEGDLENMQVPNLLQSVGMNKLTGRLEIKNKSDMATVWFHDGVPLHCVMRNSEGDNALIELVSWEEGQFHFFPEPKIDKKTVNKRFEFLLMEGATFQDQHNALLRHNLTMDSFLVRKHAALTEKEFEGIVNKGAPVDMSLQKKIYVAVDNKSSLFEILRSAPLSKVEWVPILFNLVTCGLIEFQKETQGQSTTQGKRIIVDWSQTAGVEKLLVRQDTGLYTFPAFLYFLEREYCRFDRFGRPFSVIIFNAGVSSSNIAQGARAENLEPLPTKAIKAMGASIAKIKRQVDLLGHFQIVYFGLVLPETDKKQAQNFAYRLSEILTEVSRTENLEGYLNVNIGVASVPEDCRDLNDLLTIAKPKPTAS